MVNYNTKTILTEMRMTVALSKMQNGELMTGFGQVIGEKNLSFIPCQVPVFSARPLYGCGKHL